jgi:CRP/FNR family transcriptional regulator, cyclic AMP receptor protein
MSTTLIESDVAGTGVEGNGESQELYRVWACDNQVYGPISISVLADWVRDSRVFRDTWLYVESQRIWCLAEKVEGLKELFPHGEETSFLYKQSVSPNGIDPFELRSFPVLAGLSNHDLVQLIQLAELVCVAPGHFIIRRKEPGDSIYFILSGSVRARILVGSEEKVLSQIPSGQFFGEMSMFTQTPRTADVLAVEDTRLLRFSAEAFRTLMTQNPSAAAPMLYSISTAMAQRIMDTNSKFQTEVASGFVWR